MTKINFEPLSQTAYFLNSMKTDLEGNQNVLASGTCFFIERDSKIYLITNWHNVTGKNPITGEYLSSPYQSPDFLRIKVYKNQDYLERTEIDIQLLDKNQNRKWLEHPIHREKVDVVAILVTISEDKLIFFPEQFIEVKNEDTQVRVKQDVFILGYPFRIMAEEVFPIWKKASIASEPIVDYGGLPKILVDTASRKGMSGSPVIYIEKRGHGIIEGTIDDIKSITHNYMQLVGIYSGRIGGDDEFSAQLGIVWKMNAIEEIIEQ